MPYSIGETLKALADDPHFKEFMQGTQDVLRGAGAAIASAPVETVRAPYSIAESMYKGYFGREPQISTENTPGGFQDIRQRMGGQDNQTKAETAGSVLGSFADPIYGGAKILGAAASTIPLMASFGSREARLGVPAAQAGMVGYHGTPHTFEKFKLEKIGTGEGGQAFGHGLYFAENPAVAKDYQLGLTPVDPQEVKYAGKSAEEMYNSAQRSQDIAHRSGNKDAISKANAKTAFWEKIMSRSHPEKVISDALRDPHDWPELYEYAKSIDRSKFNVGAAGNLYKVHIPDEAIDKMLDWDKPVSEQPEKVKKALTKLGITDEQMTGGKAYNAAWERMIKTGKAIPAAEKKKQLSEKLRKLGIPGIKYFDAGSRDVGKGTRNFVVFDENLPQIIGKGE